MESSSLKISVHVQQLYVLIHLNQFQSWPQLSFGNNKGQQNVFKKIFGYQVWNLHNSYSAVYLQGNAQALTSKDAVSSTCFDLVGWNCFSANHFQDYFKKTTDSGPDAFPFVPFTVPLFDRPCSWCAICIHLVLVLIHWMYYGSLETSGLHQTSFLVSPLIWALTQNRRIFSVTSSGLAFASRRVIRLRK